MKAQEAAQHVSSSFLSQIQPFIQDIHNVGPQRPLYSLFVTGGGVSAPQWLLSVPGGSRSVMEVQIPYTRQALREVAGQFADSQTSLCSESWSLALAKAAYDRSARYLLGEHRGLLLPGAAERVELLGLGLTASLASAQPKRGAHHAHLAAYSAAGLLSLHVELDKGARSREDEDIVVSLLLLDLLRAALRLPSLFASLSDDNPHTRETDEHQYNNEHNDGHNGGHNDRLSEERGCSEWVSLVRSHLRPGDSLRCSREAPRDPVQLLGEAQDEDALLLALPLRTRPPSHEDAGIGAEYAEGVEEDASLSSRFFVYCSLPLYASYQRSSSSGSPGTRSNDSSAANPSPRPASYCSVLHGDGDGDGGGALVVLPGSFRPLHAGHVALLRQGVQPLLQQLQRAAVGVPPLALFELSVCNADKPPLSAAELRRRLRQFVRPQIAGGVLEGVALTSRPLLRDKARLLPGARWLLGADTLLRLADQ
eukprot:gene40962-49968_t